VARATAWVGAKDIDALVQLLAQLRAACGERLVAFEMLSAESLALILQHVADVRAPLASAHAFHALIELADTQGEGLSELLENSLGHALEQQTVDDVAVSVSGAQTQAFWKIREGISQAQMRAGKAVKHDIALPISAIAAFAHEAGAAVRAAQPGVRIINFGHLGDGNLHYNVLLPLGTPPRNWPPPPSSSTASCTTSSARPTAASAPSMAWASCGATSCGTTSRRSSST
jgi:FAD/FMN-containing dehydrogenase